jgi:hypothetical protein
LSFFSFSLKRSDPQTKCSSSGSDHFAFASRVAILPPPTSNVFVGLERSGHFAFASNEVILEHSDPPTSSEAIVFPLPSKTVAFSGRV